MNTKSTIIAIALSLPTALVAQEASSKANTLMLPKGLRLSGYVQAQAEWGQEDASLRVGKSRTEQTGKSFSRMGIRRGRIKASYEQGIGQAVLQLDMTERGVGLKDAYLSIRSPWSALGQSSLKAGVFDRPFGTEISYSSARRESPERSAVYNALFPEERDMGIMITLRADKDSWWSRFTLEAGLFAGNGIKQETDSRKDFIGHLSYKEKLNKTTDLGLGFSYYNGSRWLGIVPGLNIDGLLAAPSPPTPYEPTEGRYFKREYFGVDASIGFTTRLGRTSLRGEYLWGVQPSTETSFRSPNSSDPKLELGYSRKFRGGYLMLVQGLGRSPLSLVLKYDLLDPNTALSFEGAGAEPYRSTDLRIDNYGAGIVWDATKQLRFMGYIQYPINEIMLQRGYMRDRLDNSFTLRMQYQF